MISMYRAMAAEGGEGAQSCTSWGREPPGYSNYANGFRIEMLFLCRLFTACARIRPFRCNQVESARPIAYLTYTAFKRDAACPNAQIYGMIMMRNMHTH